MRSPEDRKRLHFILGNVILGLAAVMLLFMGRLWEILGAWSLILWMAMAAGGVYLITKDKDAGPGGPPN
ncbi:hypothetical protein [Thioalkalivibrio thiocyanodenitrificans]|uniref:hypothetical protein n=1 Tax=Thioalkalivibrio thiocyanodenitrificans TaxID=243063 RepID=UPI0003759301|nr:hypothetical protein [Thioalkalivibrio thiocyanodenitrificans]